MGECKSGECAPKEESSSTSGCEMTDMVKKLSDEAWCELMKDKMKVEFEKNNGEKMSRVAAVSVEACNQFWQAKMQGKQQCAEFSEKLKQAFMG